MERPPRVTDPEKLCRLTAEDVRRLMEFYTEEEKEGLVAPLIESNGSLRTRIAENEEKIRREREVNRMFLRKMWGVLTGDEKREGVEFFKEIESLIDGSCE